MRCIATICCHRLGLDDSAMSPFQMGVNLLSAQERALPAAQHGAHEQMLLLDVPTELLAGGEARAAATDVTRAASTAAAAPETDVLMRRPRVQLQVLGAGERGLALGD